MTNPTEPTGYRAIKAEVLTRMRNGVWSPGMSLPGEVDLAEEFATTRTTVNRALRELAEEGYLERKRKAGTKVLKMPRRQARFAIPQIQQEIEDTGADYRYARVSRTEEDAPGWLSSKLSLPQPARVIHVRAMHYANGQPHQFEDRWIVTAIVPEAAAETFVDQGPSAWLVDTVPLTTAEISFSATRVTSEVAEFLEVAPGDPAFLFERTTWLDADAVTYVRLYHREGYRMTTRY